MSHYRHALACCGALLLSACAVLTPAPQTTAADELEALFKSEWQRSLKENPVTASALGDRRYNGQWPDLSLDAIEASHAADLDALEAVRAIDTSGLNAEQALNHRLFENQLALQVEGHAYGQFLIPLNQRGGVQTLDELTGRLRFSQRQDYLDWISRLQALGRYVDQHIALMHTGMLAEIVPPRVIMERVAPQIEKQLVAKPGDSGFYAPFNNFPDSFSEAERAELANSGRAAIEEVVLPAYRRFARFFNDEYLPACRNSIGASALPDGKAFYAYRSRLFTTTELSPEQIHELGLSEVARIRAQMERIIAELKFQGSFAEFLEFLRSDPQFYFETGEEILREYRNIAKRIDPELVKLFGTLPRMPYGVKAIPEAIAPDTTTAYYFPGAPDGSRAGYFYANLYRPEVRPKFEMEALTVHEAMPGHHLQIAIAQELGELPEFRRYSGYTAFVEGWGLYSESLGEELGLYTDPYSKFGQLTYEMWRAVRLVVDTGMHAKGWTRQQAIDYFKANAGKAEHDIINEIDRYIAWPGQALAYKIGELKIKELRARAEARLAEHFDIRAFHDTVLGAGAVPLDVLEDRVEAWIAATEAERAP